MKQNIREWRGWEPACKPGSVENGHSSGTCVTACLKRPTRGPCGPHAAAETACPPIWSCSRWGLPCRRCYQRRGALLPHHFTLTGSVELRRCIFCGTFRRLSPPRRYLAPCPPEPGLSSAPPGGSDHSADSREYLKRRNEKVQPHSPIPYCAIPVTSIELKVFPTFKGNSGWSGRAGGTAFLFL